jgi:UDP-N-acetylmuramoylalanine--D-glutamate ligase
MRDIQGQRALVVGLARSGRAAALLLRSHGAIVTVTDSREPAEFAEDMPVLLKQKIGLELGTHRPETFLKQDFIVVSPGVFPEPGPLQAARARGIPVYPEIEIASWFLKGTLLGVTGSNGKTTTTTLIGKILEASQFDTFVGGNIGIPLSATAERVTDDSMIVAELSSFQLEAIDQFHPQVAVLLNITANHLDRHPDLEAYARAKARIFRNQRAADCAVLNVDDPEAAKLIPTVASRKILFSRRRELPEGVFQASGSIVYRTGHLERVIMPCREVRLKGEFNLEDVLAATAASLAVGADFEAIRAAVQTFKGVEHRLEFVRELSGVDFYNNSKATSVAATENSLQAFAQGVHLIMGGKDKGAPYEPIKKLLRERVRYIYLIGAAAPRIEKELRGPVEMVRSGDLRTAVCQAFERARQGDTILLAPACSSFDQFTDYEERGRFFKDVVEQLAQDVELGRIPDYPAGAQRQLEAQGLSVLPDGPDASGPAATTDFELQPPEPARPTSRTDAGKSGKTAAVAKAGGSFPPPAISSPKDEQPGAEEPPPHAAAFERTDVQPSAAEAGAKPSKALETAETSGASEKANGGISKSLSPLERVYIYEVSSEEFAPPDQELTEGDDRADASSMTWSDTSEVAEDEKLPFEMR